MTTPIPSFVPHPTKVAAEAAKAVNDDWAYWQQFIEPAAKIVSAYITANPAATPEQIKLVHENALKSQETWIRSEPVNG